MGSRNVKIIEQGNGLSQARTGAVLVDEDGETVTVTACSGNIHTDDARGNYVLAEVESGGELSDEQALSQLVKVSYR